MYPLRAVGDNYAFLGPEDDCEAAARALEEYDYQEDFCIGWSFESGFIARLMAAGFLVMSETMDASPSGDGAEREFTVLFPRHHLIRSCLFFPELHIKKSIRRRLSQYELRFDTDFDLIVDKCLKKHGDGWLTPDLVGAIREIRKKSRLQREENSPGDAKTPAWPVSFGLYRGGELKAGEFGIIAKNTGGGPKVYTSYSGYIEESNAGTVQMILTAKYLEKNGFAFWDLGMPLPYKLTLGAREISRMEFMEHFFGVDSVPSKNVV